MKVTIEISKYPLSEDYENQVLEFIDRLKQHSNISISTNATSTHIVGDYDSVMIILSKEIKTSFEKYEKMIFVTKILKGKLDIEKRF